MALAASCPRCTTPLNGDGEEFSCDTHGVVVPLWRSAMADYETFTQVLRAADGLPSYVPWPVPPGWSVCDLGVVAGPYGALATVASTGGPSDLDGDVAVTVVSEEPGVGLGARVAGLPRDDAGATAGSGPPAVRVKVEGHPVPLWVVPSGDGDDVLERLAFVGEWGGRWLWLVVRPASAGLLLHQEWLLVDAGGLGPEAVDLPFGGVPPAW